MEIIGNQSYHYLLLVKTNTAIIFNLTFFWSWLSPHFWLRSLVLFAPQDLTNRLMDVEIHIVWICSLWGGRTEELRLKIKGTDDVLTDEISQQLWQSVLGSGQWRLVSD